jgi:LmbE family N-acetylglucosaminyl deacetylase
MKKILLALFTYCQLLPGLPNNVFSQSPQSWTSSDMYLALRKLNVLGSVLYVAAHPDDENTRLITYFSKDKLYRTGYLSITRGDGGQNLIGDEQGIELGLIRTQELLAARRIDGGEQFFSRAFDFGYSKNPEETFSKWHKEKILSDVVWVIRKFQPDVIITRFPTTGEGGHGHHTASAILANEAFVAAADHSQFPEQLQYVKPWQVKRILWNTFNFGGTNTITPDQFRIDVGGYNPLLGKSYGEIAAESRSQHKSQGFGVPASRGESFESFKTTGGTAPVNDLMDDVTLGWKRVAGGEEIEKKINELIAAFDLLHPEKSVQGLVNLYKAIDALQDGYWKFRKLKELKDLIEQCSGLFIDATTTEQFAVQTDSLRINFSLNNRLGVSASLREVVIPQGWIFDSSYNQALAKNKNFNFNKTVFVGEDNSITQPYWLFNKMEEGYYNISFNQLNEPGLRPAYQAAVTINIYGVDIEFIKHVKYKFTDPVKGEVYEPLVILPRVLVSPDNRLKIAINKNDLEGTLNFTKKSKTGDIKIKYVTADQNGINAIRQSYSPQGFSLTGSNNKLEVVYKIQQAKNQEYHFYYNDGHMPGHMLPQVDPGRNSLDSFEFDAENLKEIKYDHIPYITYFQKAIVKNVNIDLKTYNKKIGYIIGAGDKVPDALDQMGYEVTLLTDKELSRNNLKQFDAIISGVRAYNTNEWLNKYYDKLMKYVNDGGNYIVQYNTSNFISSIKNKIGPYDFTVSRTRITDENAFVNFLKPEHPVLNFPNKITTEDFKGWVQERSVYHAEKWDKNFETIFSMSDPGEKADEGSLIIAKYGKGYFTYTGIVFFRELPAGVPGAYRLLANLIALNRKKAF